MKKIRTLILSFGLGVMTLCGIFAIAAAQPAAAAPITSVDQCSVRFLTFPTWFKGLVKLESGKCIVVEPDAVGGLSPFIWRIALNLIEIALQLVIYLAIGFMLFAGLRFINSAGNPEEAAKARQTIINAAIGIAISFAAIATINLISGILITNP